MDLHSYFSNIIMRRARRIDQKIIGAGLELCSYLYYSVLHGVYSLYKLRLARQYTVNVPVISVGNITFGGTGKTPVCAFIARELHRQGKKVAIVSRGYKARSPGTHGDEARLLAYQLPADIVIRCGRDRRRVIEKLLKENTYDVIILDDGFQRWSIKRNLDIVLIDAMNPFGIGKLIPRGSLREPLHALRRADIILLTRADDCVASSRQALIEQLRQYASKAVFFQACHRPLFLYELGAPDTQEDLTFLASRSIVALSSIGNPDSFLMTLEKCGARVVCDKRFPDHHDYTEHEIQEVVNAALKAQVDVIVTTQKDEMRLREIALTLQLSTRILVMPVSITLVGDDEQKFFTRVSAVI